MSELATDSWAGKEGALAISQGTHWVFQTPYEGMRIYDRSEARMRFYREGWIASDPISNPIGGTTIDAEARGTIATLLQSLRSLGILPAN